MLIIRLKPIGRKKRIAYRVVVMEKRSKLNGRAIDDLGFYDPTVMPALKKIDRDKLKKWQENGAEVSMAVTKLLD